MAATLTPLIGGSSAPYLYLLPPCLVLLAIDIAVRKFSPRPTMFTETTEEQESSEPIPANPPRRSRYPQPLSLAVSTQKLSSKARNVRALFNEYERQLSKDGESSPSLSSSSESPSIASSVTSSTTRHILSLELRQCRALARTCSDPTPYTDVQQVDRAVTRAYKHKPKKATCPIFAEFCMNILKEAVRQGTLATRQKEAEIESLKQILAKESQTERRSIEVQASDGVEHESILRTELDKAQKETEELREEKERMRKAGESMITRSEKQIVLDTEKDRLVEGSVKDVLDEAQEERRAINELREEHEKAMREMISEWRKEQRAMRQQIETMRRALAAKAMEQEISNELEDRLFNERTRRSTKDDVGVVDEYTQEILFGSEDGDRTLLDDMSMLSASSTCVGSVGNSPQPTPSKSSGQRIKAELSVAIPRRRRAYSMCCNPPPPPIREPRKPVDPSEFVGFSFNPLFFGEGVEKPRSKSVMSSLSIEDNLSWSGKSQVDSSDVRPRSRRTSNLTRPTPLRIAWRV